MYDFFVYIIFAACQIGNIASSINLRIFVCIYEMSIIRIGWVAGQKASLACHIWIEGTFHRRRTKKKNEMTAMIICFVKET